MRRSVTGFIFAPLVVTAALSAAPVCDDTSVLTLLGTDTATDRALFALRAPRTKVDGWSSEVDGWLIVLDGPHAEAQLLPDTLAGLRTGSSHGPGPFLGATPCGATCLQPVRLGLTGWEPVGPPIEHERAAAVHFSYDRGGAPWAALHSLSHRDDLVDVTAYRWSGHEWEDRGRLLVQAVGSPAAAPDPGHEDAILVGSGRFMAADAPSHWVPALPAPEDSPGGQVIAVGDAAAYLTFDSRLYASLDGGSTWFRDPWAPWRQRGAESPGRDYWIDLPAAAHEQTLAALWYDERVAGKAALHLSRWSPRSGWSDPATLPLDDSSMAVDHALSTASGRWLLLGPCLGEGQSARLEALILDPGSPTADRTELTLERGW